MYLDTPSYYSYLSGMMTKPGLNENDFIRLLGLEPEFSFELLQSTFKLYKNIIIPDKSFYKYKQIETYNFSIDRNKVIINIIEKNKICKTHISMEFTYITDCFPIIQLSIKNYLISKYNYEILSNEYIERVIRINREDRKLNEDIYNIIINALSKEIPKLLYEIYIANECKLIGGHEDVYYD